MAARKSATKRVKKASAEKPYTPKGVYKDMERKVTEKYVTFIPPDGGKPIKYPRAEMAARTHARWARPGAVKRHSETMKRIHALKAVAPEATPKRRKKPSAGDAGAQA